MKEHAWVGGVAQYEPPARVRPLRGFLSVRGEHVHWSTSGSVWKRSGGGKVAFSEIQPVARDPDGSVVIAWRNPEEQHLAFWPAGGLPEDTADAVLATLERLRRDGVMPRADARLIPA